MNKPADRDAFWLLAALTAWLSLWNVSDPSLWRGVASTWLGLASLRVMKGWAR